MEENRARELLYNKMMAVPHRDYQEAVTPFLEALDSDPLFSSKAMVYFATNSATRDLQDSAIIALLQSDPQYRMFREAGRCLLLGSKVYRTEPDGIVGLPYFRFFRVMRFISESAKKVPRLFKGIMNDFLAHVESDESRLTNMLLNNKRDVAWAYRIVHRPPHPLVQSVAFDNEAPDGTVFAKIKAIALCRDASRQAEMLLDSNIPYRIAQSLPVEYTSEIGVALISLMTPTEAMNSSKWVVEKGLMNIPEVRTAMENKVSQSTKSVASAKHRKSAQTEDAGLRKAIDDAVQKATDEGVQIGGNLLLCVDRSGSMQDAIDVAKECGMRVAPHCDGEIMVVVFNDVATEIQVSDKTSVKGWEQAFAPVKPNGQTSMGCALRYALNKGFDPTAGILIISDGAENAQPYYADVVKSHPHYRTVSLTVGSPYGNNSLHSTMQHRNVPFEAIAWKGDYYAFDQIVSLFSGEPVRSLAEKIMDIPLPYRIGR